MINNLLLTHHKCKTNNFYLTGERLMQFQRRCQNIKEMNTLSMSNTTYILCKFFAIFTTRSLTTKHFCYFSVQIQKLIVLWVTIGQLLIYHYNRLPTWQCLGKLPGEIICLFELSGEIIYLLYFVWDIFYWTHFIVLVTRLSYRRTW